MFEGLTSTVDGMVLPVDGDVLAEGYRFLDHLGSKLSAVAGEFDAAELWDLEGATSLAAWLRGRAGMSNRDALRTSATARRLRLCPVTRAAWEAGDLSGAQVQAITANVNAKTAPLFAEHEAAVVPMLIGHDLRDTAFVMRAWAENAKAFLGLDEPDDSCGTAHLSPALDGRARLDADLDPEQYQVVRKALRLALGPKTTDDTRSPAERRCDALVGIFRHYLDHQTHSTGGHHRPHLNLAIDYQDLVNGTGQGTFLDSGGTITAADALRVACDANVHRFITNGKTVTLDYGRSTRTVSPELFTALAHRDRGCRFPGCDRPVDWCQAHHVEHWLRGGPTDQGNLALFCDRHHHVIHRPRWRVKLHPTGTIDITDPQGHTRTTNPPLRT